MKIWEYLKRRRRKVKNVGWSGGGGGVIFEHYGLWVFGRVGYGISKERLSDES